MMKGALFDLDGVLADTASLHFKAWRKMVRKNFERSLPDELEEKTKGISRSDSLSVILDYLEITVSETEFNHLAEEKNLIYRDLLKDLGPDDVLPGMRDFITDIKKKNIQTALASASRNGPFILERTGLSDYFNAIVDPSKIQAGKPAPDIYLAAAAAIGISPRECVGFEDAVSGIQSLKAAGIVSVGIGSGYEVGQADLRFSSTEDINYDDVEEIWAEITNNA